MSNLHHLSEIYRVENQKIREESQNERRIMRGTRVEAKFQFSHIVNQIICTTYKCASIPLVISDSSSATRQLFSSFTSTYSIIPPAIMDSRLRVGSPVERP